MSTHRKRTASGKLDAAISALNAILGDYLRARVNELEIPMGLYDRDGPLACTRQAIAKAHPDARGKLCILIHGLGQNERVWFFPGRRRTSYGSLLRRDLGYTPFYVRYNTGLHISENGESLANLLEALVAHYPVRVREIILLGHSMGGLVTRSACYSGTRHEHGWVERLRRVFYIGSPHLGAPMEKLGNVIAWVLSAIGNPYTKLVADIGNLRSSGIKDLRYANIVRQHWEGRDADALLQGHGVPVPLLPTVAHYALVGTLTTNERHLVTQLLGDAVVRVPSATGRSTLEDQCLRFSRENVRVFARIGHSRLAHDARVYSQIKAWCAGEPS